MSKSAYIKRVVRTGVIFLLVVYFGIILLLNMPPVQQFLTRQVTQELSQILKTEISIGNINVGLLNRIIIQNLSVNDRNGKEMLKASRLSAKFDIPALLQKKIRINSVQLFGLDARLNRKDSLSPFNFQFVIDAFSTKDSLKKKTPLDLRINTLLIRRGQVRYDLLSAPPAVQGRFDASHAHIYNLSATLALKTLTKDSIDARIRRMSFNERSGFQLRRLALHAMAGRNGIEVEAFSLGLPRTEVTFDTLSVRYPSPDALKRDLRDVRYILRLHSTVTPSDLSSLAPALQHFDDRLTWNFALEGKGLRAECTRFALTDDERHISIKADALIDARNRSRGPYLFCEVGQMNVSELGTTRIYRNLTGKSEAPDILKRLKDIHFRGDVSGYPYQLTTHGKLSAGVGEIQANVTMHTDTLTRLHSFSGHVTTDNLQMGKLLAREGLGNAAFDIEMKGFKYHNNKPESHVKGEIQSIDYKGYTYHNIALDGQYKAGGFKGHIALDDENGTVRIDGSFDTSQSIPYYNLHAQVRNLRPHALRLTDKYINTGLSLNLTADFSGRSLDDMLGKISLDSLDVAAPEPENSYYLPNLSLTAQKDSDGNNELRIESPFMQGSVQGNYSYRTLATGIRRMAAHYLPSLFPGGASLTPTDNRFSINLRVDNSDFFAKVLNIPINLHMPATLQGYIDDKQTRVHLFGSLPEFTYKQTLYESGVLLFENPDDRLHCHLTAGMRMKKGSMVNVALNADAANDLLQTTLNWGNNTNNTYSGKVDATTRFNREENGNGMHAQVDLHASRVILNDTIWRIHPARVDIRRDSIDIHNFLFEHEGQHLKVNGRLGKSDEDSCQVDLRNISLLYVMDIIRFQAVKFSGLISGKVALHHLLKDPEMKARLNADGFSLNDALLGKADIQAFWDKEIGGIRLDADIREDSLRFTRVKGFISPKQKGLDLHIQAGGTNLAFLHHFTRKIFNEVNGRGYGDVRLFGPFSGLDLQGSVRATMEMGVTILNTRFTASADSVRFSPGHIGFRNVRLTDTEGHTGRANGELKHTKLKQLLYDFTFDTDNMLVYNTSHATTNTPFYGHVYGTGNVTLHGGNNMLNVDGNMRAENHTTFTYNLGTAAEATSNSFITFVDRTPRRREEAIDAEVYHYLNHPDDKDEDDIPLDMHLNLQIEPTANANMRIIMDPVAGDYISGTGTGSLRVNYYNKGDFQIFGNYIINEGIYKMSMQNIIRKDFTLQPGGTVTFNGNPKEAILNVQAVYTVNFASLNDLIANASTSKGTVRVNCLLNLTGELTAPNLSFDLELPTVSEEDRELVRSLTRTEEQMNTQIIYLLGVGKFYTYDYANNTAQSNATSSLAFNTLSGQLNNILSQAINSRNWNLGTNLSTGERGWSDVEAEAILSGRLLNNRLIINGNFGYRENTLRNTNFVGDFEAIWLLTKNGEFRLRGYNQTNDRYFTKSTLTTQGIGIMYKKDFTYWHELTDWLLRHRRKQAQPAALPAIQEKRRKENKNQ